MSINVGQIGLAFLGSLGFSVLFHLRGKKLLLAALGGALSWGLYLLLEPQFPSDALRYFFSSFFVAVYAEILARILKTPATTFLIPAIVPHIPGGSLYYTMCYALNRDWGAFLAQAFHTILLALCLAMGIIAVLSIIGVLSMISSHFWYGTKARQKHSHPNKENVS